MNRPRRWDRRLSVGGLISNVVTDVDAVASRDDRLLLVSCKARMPRHELHRGEYGAVAADIMHVNEAASTWRTRVKVLRDHPRGDNYDISAWRRISGIVCYPYLPFSTDPWASETVFGMRLWRITHPQELEEALLGD